MSEQCQECKRPLIPALGMMTAEQWESGPDSVCHAHSALRRPARVPGTRHHPAASRTSRSHQARHDARRAAQVQSAQHLSVERAVPRRQRPPHHRLQVLRFVDRDGRVVDDRPH